jgi:hypothetical protein
VWKTSGLEISDRVDLQSNCRLRDAQIEVKIHRARICCALDGFSTIGSSSPPKRGVKSRRCENPTGHRPGFPATPRSCVGLTAAPRLLHFLQHIRGLSDGKKEASSARSAAGSRSPSDGATAPYRDQLFDVPSELDCQRLAQPDEDDSGERIRSLFGVVTQ